jgi:hypothetical protein
MKHVRVFKLIALALLVTAGEAMAQGGTATTRLRGFDEVPAISSPGGGHFTATVNEDGSEIAWNLTYEGLLGNVTQAHIHFGQRGVNGGIMIFLCSNLGNGPPGTQACPVETADISGTIHAEDVGNGASSQGIGAGGFQRAQRAIRAGIGYVNVHTTLYPGGEIRGQLTFTASGSPIAIDE